jgi:hypothetical protein
LGGYDHQCILVEIDSLSDANIITKSARRNMRFNELSSVFEQKAKIDVAGLGKPRTGGEHNIILRQSMREYEPFLASSNKQYLKYNPDIDKDTIISKTRWLVHGYQQTGMFVEYRGSRFPVSEPVASFGYVITHSGAAVSEWDYAIDGEGVSKQKDAGGEYYTLSIPENGFKEVTTRVESVERDERSIVDILSANPWLMLFIILVLLYVIWITMRKASSA